MNTRLSRLMKLLSICPFIRNTLDAGGANLVGDPQWHDVVALACHTANPRETAHQALQ